MRSRRAGTPTSPVSSNATGGRRHVPPSRRTAVEVGSRPQRREDCQFCTQWAESCDELSSVESAARSLLQRREAEAKQARQDDHVANLTCEVQEAQVSELRTRLEGLQHQLASGVESSKQSAFRQNRTAFQAAALREELAVATSEAECQRQQAAEGLARLKYLVAGAEAQYEEVARAVQRLNKEVRGHCRENPAGSAKFGAANLAAALETMLSRRSSSEQAGLNASDARDLPLADRTMPVSEDASDLRTTMPGFGRRCLEEPPFRQPESDDISPPRSTCLRAERLPSSPFQQKVVPDLPSGSALFGTQAQMSTPPRRSCSPNKSSGLLGGSTSASRVELAAAFQTNEPVPQRGSLMNPPKWLLRSKGQDSKIVAAKSSAASRTSPSRRPSPFDHKLTSPQPQARTPSPGGRLLSASPASPPRRCGSPMPSTCSPVAARLAARLPPSQHEFPQAFSPPCLRPTRPEPSPPRQQSRRMSPGASSPTRRAALPDPISQCDQSPSLQRSPPSRARGSESPSSLSKKRAPAISGQSLQPRSLPRAASAVALSLCIVNIRYEQLESDPGLLAIFKATVRLAIAAEVGTLVEPSDVTLGPKYGSGGDSVVIGAVVTADLGTEPGANFLSRLRTASPALSANVTKSLRSIEGLDIAIRTGISVGSVTVAALMPPKDQRAAAAQEMLAPGDVGPAVRTPMPRTASSSGACISPQTAGSPGAAMAPITAPSPVAAVAPQLAQPGCVFQPVSRLVRVVEPGKPIHHVVRAVEPGKPIHHVIPHVRHPSVVVNPRPVGHHPGVSVKGAAWP